MLIKFGVLIVLVLGTFIFLGVKISESIKQKEIKMLFFCLYGMTLFTIFNLGLSVYFYVALKHKRGPVGPRGKKGEMGDTGEHGICDNVSCHQKSIQNIIVDYLEKKKSYSLSGQDRKAICSFSKKLFTPQSLAGNTFQINESLLTTIEDNLKTVDNLEKLKNALVAIYNATSGLNRSPTLITVDDIKSDFCQ
jgi:hypothetical protein